MMGPCYLYFYFPILKSGTNIIFINFSYILLEPIKAELSLFITFFRKTWDHFLRTKFGS